MTTEENKGAAMPSDKPIIRLKTLELIAKDIADSDTGSNIVKFLLDCGVENKFNEYPQTKWRMIYAILSELTTSKNIGDKKILWKILGEAVHPLTHNGDEVVAEKMREKFNNYLKYDRANIHFSEKENSYEVYFDLTEEEMNEIMSEDIEKEEREAEKQLEFLCLPENKEKVSLLRKAYLALMSVIDAFCENPARPTIELNENFQFLYKLVNKTISELSLQRVDKSFFSRNKHFFYLPFSNLFSAEKVYQERGGGKISWQMIRPEMNAMYGDIEELYLEVSGSDVLAEPNKQKKLNEIQLYLSELKEKSIELKEKNRDRLNQRPITKIEITSMPELKINGLIKDASKKLHKSDLEKEAAKSAPDSYKISVKDREIWVNDWLIGKPHGAGNNLEFFEYIRSRPSRTLIERDEMSNAGGGSYIKESIKNKSFIKILNELGFKGEILKTFFNKRSKNTLAYMGDRVIKKDLEKSGIKASLFLKELELAHIKNNPD